MASHVRGSESVPLLRETIGATLTRIAAAFGDRDALIACHQSIRYSYAQLAGEADRAARALLAFGVQRGDRVGIWSPNAAEWLITQYAAAKAGAILVNINPAYGVRELEYALSQSGVSVLVMARRFRQLDYVEMLGAVAPDLPASGDRPLALAKLPSLRHVIYLGTGAGSGGASWLEFMERGDRVPPSALREVEDATACDDAVNIQYTSGTTGSPKGATLSHRNILNNGYFVGEALRYTEKDRICVPVPFYHCFGCVMGNLAALTHGAAVILPAESFDAEATLRAVEAHACTSIYGVPTMFIGMLGHRAFDSVALGSLRTGIMAGAPCPIEVMRQVIERMHVSEVTICYGMTETSPVSFQSAVDDPIETRVSTVGRIHPHVECRIVSPDAGAVVPRGTPGELCTRGYSVMLGYWDNPAATAAAVDGDGWMHTGDLAVMRDDGCVNIVGRIKDMIIRGGENVYPREIEDFLYTHPKIREVQVVGVPDVKYGEEICAWIRLREGQQATEDEIRNFCRGQIAAYKIPRYVRFTGEFPATVTGKIQKYRMREISIAELGLDAAGSVKTA